MVKKGQARVVKADFGRSKNIVNDLSVDSVLIGAVRNGDEKAFEVLLARYQKSIHRFAYRFLGNRDAAKDVAQDTFLRFYMLLQNKTEIEYLSALLFKIAKNCCIDIKRKQQVHSLNPEELPVESRTALHVLNEKERRVKIETAVLNLPENQRAVILLRHTESLSYQDIAQVMSISVSAVESLLFRARNKLRRLLEREEMQISTPEN